MTVKPLLALLAVAGLCLAPPVWAQVPQTCVANVVVNDHLSFTPDQIEIPASCEQFTVVLEHQGRLPKVASPRNWVLTAPEDADAVARDASIAGKDNGWVTPSDPRVLAASAVVGRNERDTVQIPLEALVAGQSYIYLCTVPGFSPTMRGQLRLQSD